jgi:hypothetical protein
VTTDEQIREALESIAGMAAAPDRVRASLQRRIRVHRQRRALVLAGAAAAATAAVGVPATLWLSRTRTPLIDPTGTGNLRIPMTLRPTWLPEDMVELSRAAMRGGVSQARTWATPAAMDAFAHLRHEGDLETAMAHGVVTLEIARPDPASTPSSWPSESPPFPQRTPSPNASVGERPAWLDGPGQVSWYSEDGLRVTVGSFPHGNSPDVTLRIANSVVRDTVAVCETALRFGWLPPQASQIWRVAVTGSGGGWSQSVQIQSTEKWGGEPVVADLSTNRLVGSSTAGDPVTLRGRPGFARDASSYGEAIVELDGGRWLRVLCYVGGANARDYAIRVLNDIVIGPDPYLGWIGHR